MVILCSFWNCTPSDLNHLNCLREDGAQTVVFKLLCAWWWFKPTTDMGGEINIVPDFSYWVEMFFAQGPLPS